MNAWKKSVDLQINGYIFLLESTVGGETMTTPVDLFVMAVSNMEKNYQKLKDSYQKG